MYTRIGNHFALIWLAITVLLLSAPAALARKKQLPAHPFDLNTATLKQLEELPGVGPVTAHAILDFREKSGPFKSVDDLLVIPRISQKKLAKIRPYVFVKGAPAKSAPKKPSAATPAKKHAFLFPHNAMRGVRAG